MTSSLVMISFIFGVVILYITYKYFEYKNSEFADDDIHVSEYDVVEYWVEYFKIKIEMFEDVSTKYHFITDIPFIQENLREISKVHLLSEILFKISEYIRDEYQHEYFSQINDNSDKIELESTFGPGEHTT